MSVKPADLDNQERGMDLSDREEKGSNKRDVSAAALEAFRARLRALRVTPPKDAFPHSPGPRLSYCDACFRRGVKAVLDAIGEG